MKDIRYNLGPKLVKIGRVNPDVRDNLSSSWSAEVMLFAFVHFLFLSAKIRVTPGEELLSAKFRVTPERSYSRLIAGLPCGAR